MDEDVESTVTKAMALWVHESLPCPDDSDGQALWRGLLLKCYGVWLGEEASGALRLGREELWMLQKVAKASAQVGKEKVGEAWLGIVSHGLLHLEAQTDVHQAVARHGEGGLDSETPAAMDRLAQWSGQERNSDG